MIAARPIRAGAPPKRTAVFDSQDSPESHQLLLDRLADQSTLVVDLATDRPGLQWFASSLLDAMGKRADTLGERRSAEADWALAQAWVISSGYTRLILDRAYALSDTLIEKACALSILGDFELVLVLQPLGFTRAQREALRMWGFHQVKLEELEILAEETA